MKVIKILEVFKKMDIFGKLFKLELICLKLLGFKFEYSNSKVDLLLKFWLILCIFSHFLIPTLALFNLAVNGFSKDFILIDPLDCRKTCGFFES